MFFCFAIPISFYITFVSFARMGKIIRWLLLPLGHMCTFDSAVAPEFALHHSFVDKIWMDWQRQSNAHLNAHFPGVATNMAGTGNVHPRDVLDNSRLPGGVRVEYQTSRRPQFLGALRHTGGMTLH